MIKINKKGLDLKSKHWLMNCLNVLLFHPSKVPRKISAIYLQRMQQLVVLKIELFEALIPTIKPDNRLGTQFECFKKRKKTSRNLCMLLAPQIARTSSHY